MDTTRPIPELLAERNELSEQIERLRKQMHALDEALFGQLEGVMKMLGVTAPAGAATKVPPTPAPRLNSTLRVLHTYPSGLARPRPARPDTAGHVIRDVATNILKQERRPMKTAELLERLESTGLRLGGKVPANNLSAHLSRSGQFQSTSSGWWLASEPVPGQMPMPPAPYSAGNVS